MPAFRCTVDLSLVPDGVKMIGEAVVEAADEDAAREKLLELAVRRFGLTDDPQQATKYHFLRHRKIVDVVPA